jgi:hypothetical protein
MPARLVGGDRRRMLRANGAVAIAGQHVTPAPPARLTRPSRGATASGRGRKVLHMHPLVASRPEIKHPVAEHHLLGASTGYMDDARGDWPELIARAMRTSRRAIELSALSSPELGPLLDFLGSRRGDLPFIYVSVHGPTKGWVAGEAELARQLGRLPAQVESVILHPDVLDDPGPLRALGTLAVLENLDHRPTTGRTPAELAPYFDELPEAGFCLDVAHVTAIDPTLALAHELLDAFGNRLRQLHISSFVRDDAKHIPLTYADVTRFWPVLRRCRGVPWILEAPLG